MKIQEIKAGILRELYELYDKHGFDWSVTLTELAPEVGASRDRVEEVLKEFKRAGLVTYEATLDDLHAIRLTSHGAESFEDPKSAIAPFVQLIVTGNQNQIGGSHNTMTITYAQALTTLAEKIEAAPDIAPEQKRAWGSAIRDIVKHPISVGLVLAGAKVAIDKLMGK